MPAQDIEDVYELSPMQQGMLFHLLYAPQSGTYNQQHTCVLQGPLNVDVFKHAWQSVVNRHPILRTSFHWKRIEKPVQVVHRSVELVWNECDWGNLTPEDQTARLDSWLKEGRQRGFDLLKVPLLQLALIRLAEDRHQFIWNLPHLLIDGWSVTVMLKEVFIAYETMRRGLVFALDPPRPYRDYIAWLRRQDLASAERFWRDHLSGFVEPTPLAPGWKFGRWPERDEHHEKQQARIAGATWRAIEALTRQHRITASTLFHGLWALLLNHYGGRDEVVFGSVVSGRPVDLEGAGSIIGVFINTLPVRVAVDRSATAIGWLQRLQGRLIEMRQYEYTPLSQIQRWSGVAPGLPLFESLLAFENYPTVALPARKGEAPLQVGQIRVEDRNNYPLSLVIEPGPEPLAWISYNKDALEDHSVAQMLTHLQTMLNRVLEDPYRTLEDVARMPEDERQRMLFDWNPTAQEFSSRGFVHEMFEAQASGRPDAIALEHDGVALTYAELNRQANQLARYLRTKGVGPESRVGICLERSVALVVSMLGALKAGGAYVPLDPEYPIERLTYMARDAELRVVLTSDENRRLHRYEGETIDLSASWCAIERERSDNLDQPVADENVAYVIYTSGSTGRPKGVAVTHGGLRNYLCWSWNAYAPGAACRSAVHTPVSFDLTVTSLLLPLVSGGTAELIRETSVVDGLAEALRRRGGYTLLKLTPSHVQALNALLAVDVMRCAAQRLVIGGEALVGADVAPWRQYAPATWLINEYGPTETVVGCCTYEVQPNDPHDGAISIGRPVANTQVYVLNASATLVPVGVPGELYIGGAGVARGYWGRPDLTAEKFLPDPFRIPGGRLYRTSDRARWNADGTLSYLGRLDGQVKVRGHRIELGEIEVALQGHAAVRDAAVVVRSVSSGDARITAYIVWHQGANAPIDDLRAYLATRLPDYMIPSEFGVLEALPLTANGKVDKSRLPAPHASGERRDRFASPKDDVEERLVRIWEEVLDVKPIGVRDSFFQLGGHSLLALRLMIKVQKEFGAAVPLAALIRSSTIEEMARLLRPETRPAKRPAIVPIQAGSRPPFVCVHPGAGDVLCYSRLASCLGSDQTFFAIQDPGVGDASVEDIALRYVEELSACQPEGPYYLGGWSFGGFVALEMAQQLVRAGREVALLALLDTAPPAAIGRGASDDDELLTTIAREMAVLFGTTESSGLSELAGVEPSRKASFVLELLKKDGVLPAETDVAFVIGLLRLFRARIAAVSNYSPAIYPGQITIFRASMGVSHETFSGWSHLSSRPLAVHEVAGDHVSMLVEPHVQTLATLLRRSLDAAQRASAGTTFVQQYV